MTLKLEKSLEVMMVLGVQLLWRDKAILFFLIFVFNNRTRSQSSKDGYSLSTFRHQCHRGVQNAQDRSPCPSETATLPN
uniref:Uncharacterized protein n=1 Tax=Anguilla anguilla TaxID=7936 RepID=A0A0E9X638_ANGAN